MAVMVAMLCGLVWWTGRSARVDPFLISINPVTGAWNLVGHSHGTQTISPTRAVQESVVGRFVQNWFTISAASAMNEARWQPCRRNDVDEDTPQDIEFANNTYAVSCSADESVYAYFISEIVPEYRMRVQNGEQWAIDTARMQIEPIAIPKTGGGMFSRPVQTFDHGATWRMWATVKSNISGDMNIVAYINVKRDAGKHPENLGFYVADFNAYKLD